MRTSEDEVLRCFHSQAFQAHNEDVHLLQLTDHTSAVLPLHSTQILSGPRPTPSPHHSDGGVRRGRRQRKGGRHLRDSDTNGERRATAHNAVRQEEGGEGGQGEKSREAAVDHSQREWTLRTRMRSCCCDGMREALDLRRNGWTEEGRQAVVGSEGGREREGKGGMGGMWGDMGG